ncbi:outer membrane protein [Bradyrhizobium sp. RDT10]
MKVDSSDGWTAGAGVEYAFTNNFLGRVEYRYTDLGRAAFVNLPTNSSELGNRVTINDVRVGIAYKF